MATITVGTNSYVTTAEADTYFDEKYGFDTWASTTADNKTKACIHATRMLETYINWYGTPVDEETPQALHFPIDEYTIETYPQVVKNAVFELAYDIISGNVDVSADPNITDLQVDVIKIRFGSPNRTFPIRKEILLMLTEFGTKKKMNNSVLRG